jgi:hypothetical protein
MWHYGNYLNGEGSDMRVRNKAAQLIFVLLTAVGAAVPAMAGYIDQQVKPDGGSSMCFSQSCSWQQAVTPGMTGLLTSLQVFSSSGHADLRFASGFGPLSSWSNELYGVDVSGVIDLTAYGFYVTAGQPFVFELSNGEEDSVLAGSYLAGGFAASPLFRSVDGAGYKLNPNWSLAYTTTVDAVAIAVPEPVSGGLVLIGLAMLGVCARRTTPPSNCVSAWARQGRTHPTIGERSQGGTGVPVPTRTAAGRLFVRQLRAHPCDRGAHLARRGAAHVVACRHRPFQREHGKHVLADQRRELA